MFVHAFLTLGDTGVGLFSLAYSLLTSLQQEGRRGKEMVFFPSFFYEAGSVNHSKGNCFLHHSFAS